MNSFQRLILMSFLLVPLLVSIGEPITDQTKGSANQQTAPAPQSLQGKWEGVVEGDASQEGITITINITGNSLHFHRDTNFWFETTFTLPDHTNPRQLHATIKRCPQSQADSIGKVVGAIFKIEDNTLTLAAYTMSEEPPKSFADTMSRYVLKRVQPEKKIAEPQKIR